MTAEEFIREKIREKYLLPPKAAMAGLQIYNVTGEDCLRWAHEFSEHSRQSPASLPSDGVLILIDGCLENVAHIIKDESELDVWKSDGSIGAGDKLYRAALVECF